jgi:hypothetical protein
MSDSEPNADGGTSLADDVKSYRNYGRRSWR